jgi:hypothetical protein
VYLNEFADDLAPMDMGASDEFASLVHGTGWRLTDVDDSDAPYYLATLRLAAES